MCTAKKQLSIRIIIWLLTLGALGWFLYMGVVPSGKIQYDYDFTKNSGFISKISPAERAGEIVNGSQKIIGNPVYFSLYTPRTFDTAKVLLEYENQDVKLVEAGVLDDKTVWRYDLRPVENVVLDQIGLVWDTIREGNTVLFQKTKKFESISDFIKRPPEAGKIAVYNYDLNVDDKIPGYKSGEKAAASIPPLQGSFEFYTYIKNENLSFDFTFKDLNQNKDADNVAVLLYYKNKIIGSWNMADDGDATDDGKTSANHDLSITTPGLPEGVYKLEIKANNDIVTEKISTKQSKLSFMGKINISSDSGKNIKIFTDSKKIGVLTTDTGSLQKIASGNTEFDINETYKQFQFPLQKASSSDLVEIDMKKGGLMISGDGVFSFEKDTMLDPTLKKADNNLDVKADGIEYIIADYVSPLSSDGVKNKEIVFDTKNAYRENGKYSFIISIPELNLEDTTSKGIILKRIHVSLEGRSLEEKIMEKFSRIFRK
jgi:hypothetical protein